MKNERLAKVNGHAILSVLNKVDPDSQCWPIDLGDTPDHWIEAFDLGAEAVLLHALDALHAAGVPADVAANRLRRGETLEDICADYGNGYDSGRGGDDAEECPEGFPNPGAGFCRGLGK